MSGSIPRQWQTISRDYPWRITYAALYAGPEGLKARATSEMWLREEWCPLKKIPSIS